jgi:hypothetical protein
MQVPEVVIDRKISLSGAEAQLKLEEVRWLRVRDLVRHVLAYAGERLRSQLEDGILFSNLYLFLKIRMMQLYHLMVAWELLKILWS